MHVHFVDARFPFRSSTPHVLTLGMFDGVHVGHAALLRRAVRAAEERGWEPAVVTFTPHPRAVLGDPAFLRMLTPLRERLALFRSLGLRRAYVLHYTPEFSRISADEFRDVWLPSLGARHVVLGEDFRYGAERRGDEEHLRAATAFTVEVVPSVPEAGVGMRTGGDGVSASSAAPLVATEVPKVSSRRVRALLAAGEVAEAARLLKRPYALEGVVVPGEGRGRRLGFPTANLLVVEPYVFPRRGVYAAWAELWEVRARAQVGAPAGRDAREICRIPAVVNVGVRPTVDGGRERVEAHLLDFSGELYGTRLRLEFVAYLREERRFPNLSVLAEQIAQDVAFARKHFV